MARIFVNTFFLLLFLTQLLPLRQVGRLLSQASMVEELPEKDQSKSTIGFEDHAKHFLFPGNEYSFLFSDNSQVSYIHLSETLPVLRASDVQTPPPDFS